MKAILEFNLPEEDEAHRCALNGWSYLAALGEAIDFIEKKMNSDEYPGEEYDTFEIVRKQIFIICNERGFSPWEG
jgi:hypothetical protein